MLFNYILVVIIIIFSNVDSQGRKRINIDGVFYECMSPKNSFERTRGVRNRICVFSDKDKSEINNRIKNKNLKLKRKFKKR